MSDVTGPISTLPGSRHRLPEGARCDDHPERLAVARVQGETDSMGSEMLDLCQQCVDHLRAHADNPCPGRCDWCKQWVDDVRAQRDIDEGRCGPVYWVCRACRDRYHARLHEELERLACEDDRGWD